MGWWRVGRRNNYYRKRGAAYLSRDFINHALLLSTMIKPTVCYTRACWCGGGSLFDCDA